MVLNSAFTKTLHIVFPPLLFWSSLSELSEMLPPGLQSSFCPQIKLNSQPSSCTLFLVDTCFMRTVRGTLYFMSRTEFFPLKIFATIILILICFPTPFPHPSNLSISLLWSKKKKKKDKKYIKKRKNSQTQKHRLKMLCFKILLSRDTKMH